MLIGVAALVVFLPSRVVAGSPVAQQEPGSAAGSAEGLIRLDFEVMDSAGKPVIGLKPGDITLNDSGKPAAISTFEAFSDNSPPRVSVELILVVDLIDFDKGIPVVDGDKLVVHLEPDRKKEHEAEDAVETFLRRNDGKLEHPTSVYLLTSDGLLGTPQPTTDGIALADAVAHHSLPGRRRSQADDWFHIMPLQAEALGVIALEQRLRPARKVLVWTGPGWEVPKRKDERLFLGIVELTTRLREARITAWGVSKWPSEKEIEMFRPRLFDLSQHYFEYNSDQYRPFRALVIPDAPPAKTPDQAVYSNVSLAVVSANTGGGIVMTQSLSSEIEKRAAEANAFYSITFDPPRTTRADDFRKITMDVARNKLTALAPAGYYNEPVFYDQPAAAEQLSVAQLETRAANWSRGQDREIAKELSHAELTERLNPDRMQTLQARLPGSKSREALQALADRSAFLPPPADEAPTDPAPDAAAQDQILALAKSYVKETILQLPNFEATRSTAEFTEAGKPTVWKELSTDESLVLTQTAKTKVLVRNEKEIAGKTSKVKAGEHGLLTVGTFGPILDIALSRAEGDRRRITWSRWERREGSPAAVFRYSSPEGSAGLHVVTCCSAGLGDDKPAESDVGFHGEIAIDPASGAILRLTVEADLKPGTPIARSAVMVEYGPLDIGGKSYICPIHSVSISRQRTEWALHEWSEGFTVYGHYETLLNDVTFSQYHLFRSESRILPGYVPEADNR